MVGTINIAFEDLPTVTKLGEVIRKECSWEWVELQKPDSNEPILGDNELLDLAFNWMLDEKLRKQDVLEASLQARQGLSCQPALGA